MHPSRFKQPPATRFLLLSASSSCCLLDNSTPAEASQVALEIGESASSAGISAMAIFAGGEEAKPPAAVAAGASPSAATSAPAAAGRGGDRTIRASPSAPAPAAFSVQQREQEGAGAPSEKVGNRYIEMGVYLAAGIELCRAKLSGDHDVMRCIFAFAGAIPSAAPKSTRRVARFLCIWQ